ncbi:MAG: SGNH/GDSL hydrolase family protein [Limisphaerales bacterium]
MKPRSWLPLICLMVCAFASVTVRADLALTNYTAAHPLKVLCSGDSITDDSSMPGAWRSYLEKLLVTNGYVFTNLGRWSTTGVSGFVQVHHEGMDSAVIAAPGVGGSPHGYTAANNYTLKSLADAFTNAFFPDLVLVDMGVNDMGRGRDPYHVATNDLSALLDLIFTKVPNAHVIVSKPTSISASTILTYGTHGTSMYKFSDAVQALATSRRAQGQNVYVADLFSAVRTNLISDGTHPTAAGFSLLANEMMFRIASITARPDYVTTPFIIGGSTWKYSDQGLDLGTDWSQLNFDDSTWSQGAGRLGYGTNGVTTTIGYGTNSSTKNITTYFRHSFVVSDSVTYTNLNVRLNREDGAVVWLNGQELYRANLPTGAISNQTKALALVSPGGDDSNTYFSTNLPITSLPAGTNVIGVEIHRNNPSGTALSFDLELFGKGVPVPPPTLSFASTAGALQLAWPTNYSSFSLQTASNLPATGAWQLVPGPYSQSNNAFEVSIPTDVGSAQFFRLFKPGQ